MISAKYSIEGNTHTLVVLGHANYAEHGKDIVCAGVSSLVQALMGWAYDTGCEIECISRDSTNNELIVSCRGNEAVKAAFSVVIIGLGQIAESYPDHLQINVSE